jgi:hypothetical protein
MEPRIAFLDSQHFIPGVTCHLKLFDRADEIESLEDLKNYIGDIFFNDETVFKVIKNS